MATRILIVIAILKIFIGCFLFRSCHHGHFTCMMVLRYGFKIGHYKENMCSIDGAFLHVNPSGA